MGSPDKRFLFPRCCSLRASSLGGGGREGERACSQGNVVAVQAVSSFRANMHYRIVISSATGVFPFLINVARCDHEIAL